MARGKRKIKNKTTEYGEKMKLGLFVDGSFLPSREGATQRIYLLAKHLPKVGIETVVFHCYRGWSDIELIRQENFTTYIVPPEIYYGDAEFLSNIILREKIDILQMCDPPLILSQGLKIKQKTSAVLIWEVHEIVSKLAKLLGTTNEDWQFLELLEYYSSLCCDSIICFTQRDKHTLSEKRIPLDKINVSLCGIDFSERDFFGPNLSSSTVLFLGNMFYEPNYRGVLSIAKEISPSLNKRKKEVTFKMVGTYPKELERQFTNENLIFKGWVDDLNQVFKETTVAIAPIKACTGMRIKILDYMAAGLPVISTYSAAFGIKHDNCILIEDNIQKFADKILYLLDSPQESQRLAQKARMQIEKYHDWNDIVIALSNLYTTAKDYPLTDLSVEVLKTINQLELPPPYWLEESLRKERFINKDSKSIDHSVVIRNHRLSLI